LFLFRHKKGTLERLMNIIGCWNRRPNPSFKREVERRLDGRVSLITGASSGIGKGAAVLLAREGSKIAVHGRDPEETEKVANDIRLEGGEAIAVLGDVSKPEDMQRVCQEVADRWGRIDVVFANAGINGVWAPLDELEPDEWDKTLEVNLKGTYLTVKYALPWLKKQGGSVIITSSVNGNRIFSNTGATAYSCSKAGQVAFCKMVALELARDHIRVNVICPGAIETNISENTEERDTERVKIPVEFPEGEIPLTGHTPGTIWDTAELVLFLASDASKHISGTEVYVDGAQSLLQG
jgi:NAD(P)-dependent dehydrogenase (short-subunit alcohol dehydrogenase family)